MTELANGGNFEPERPFVPVDGSPVRISTATGTGNAAPSTFHHDRTVLRSSNLGRDVSWAITEPGMRAVRSFLEGNWTEAQIEAAAAAGTEERAADSAVASDVAAGGVAVLPLRGLITPSASLLALLFGGGGGLRDFGKALRALDDSSEVSTIVFDVDSPGGQVDLVPETAAMIRSVKTRTVAHANTMAASAAYWLASQADEVVVSPSGEVGSIGAVMLHEDVSKGLEDAGVKITMISAGKYKTEGNPFEPLGEEAEAHFQETVDTYYGMFVGDVAAGRGVSTDTVLKEYGQGRMMTADRAVAAGLADRKESFEGTLQRLGAGDPSPERDGAAIARVLFP